MTDIIESREAILGATHRRSFFFQRDAINVDSRTVTLAFSSEEPVERWGGVEILDHSPSSCDLMRLRNGGAVLVDHDPCDQVGVVESCQIEADRVGRAVVRFGRSERAEEIFQDIVDGIRKHVSVGYRVHKLDVTDPESDTTTYRVTAWEPLEISIVSIPADASVGVGRALETPEAPEAPEATEPQETPADVPPTVEAAPAPVIPERSNTMSIEVEVNEVAEVRANNARELAAIGDSFKDHGGLELATRAIKEGKDTAWLQNEIMQKMASAPARSAPDLGLSEKEARNFSVLRAIHALTSGDWKNAGFERECHDALTKRLGESKNGGVYVPYEVQKRDMSTAANGGGYLVATDNLGGSFIDLLRNRTVVGQLGAVMLSGLKGNVTIPKQTAAGTAYWLANEATAITESNQTIGQLALSPKNLGAYTEISRQLMMQSSPAADQLVMNDLARVMAIAIDSAALSGNGSGAPVGIINTSGIGSVTGTSIDYAKVLEFQTDVASANALAANSAYVTTPAVASLLAQRQRFSSTDTPLWQGNVLDGQVSGFRAMASNQMASGTMLFGDFSQVVIGEWGVLELALNPYAGFTSGIVGIRAFQTCDVGIRQAGAFSYASSIT